ncbi:hypothetical protein [Paenibacillus sp. DCT19]|uniref:hypothetical protein n=1 Tax=Paenibacillus sp. DCT19 TaxID=2211212 RepID=UPI000FE19A4C|nr:hypothetical protein [Paenibacillus sp. DCT19]
MESLDHIYYVALTFHIPKQRLKPYRTYLETQVIPVYKRHRNTMISDYKLYTHKITTEKHGDFPVWNILHVLQLHHREKADSLQNELDRIQPFPEAVVVRQELLSSTPRSHFPIQSEQTRRRWLKPLQVVEYVDVEFNKLEQFRDIMMQRNGPAMHFICNERRWCHSFYALETEQVWTHHPDYPGWNQLHIIALYPEAPFKYKKDFGLGLARASDITFEENMEQLKQIRTMRYKCISSRL